MSELPSLLTIVLEEPGTLDRESAMYRRLVAARLRFDAEFSILQATEPLTTRSIGRLCADITSKYVVFMRTSHQVSANYAATIIGYLRTRTVYLAEPVMYTGRIAGNIAGTAIDDAYHYARDTDIFGSVFNTRRLADALEAIGDVDRAGLYTSYRLYWSIEKVKPLPAGYSVATETKAAIGLQLSPEAKRLVPVIPTSSKQLRLYLLRFMALFLRGMRAQKATAVSLEHLRELVTAHNMTEMLAMVEPLQPFEAAWIRWLADPCATTHLFKQLSDKDSYLVFLQDQPVEDPARLLYELLFGDDVLAIAKTYLPRTLRPGHARPGSYNFYQRPISPHSSILFFDRPLQADDNAEHLYDYFRINHPEFTESYFAINPKSPDWERLEKKGFKLIPIFSPEFYEKFLISDLVVSSQIYNIRYRGKSFANSRFVYLQHGIQLNDMSDWVLSKYFDVFIATGQLEADYMAGLAPVETLNSGLPRLESLAREPRNSAHLLFMPTWRFNLNQVSTEQFLQSRYFQAIDQVLTDPALLTFLDATDRRLEVKLHPNVEKRTAHFRFSERVVLSELSYREAISSAEMVFTDYSSAVLDASFVHIPIAYYHWDHAEFFREQPYEGRLDYEEEGLGPVFHQHVDLIDYLVNERFASEEPLYRARRDRFFKGVDADRINRKIVERMLAL
ncbi:CDP-glycerol glycerophosphotransferase family protein [Paenarthrobacter sp. NPDC090520]|uniref:CDP-glycerol glycerophosphotransferase family protein n=1 Tax=Paenarthrobacter sp. NPDC090520 TaxID=3364382 RepID=UPI00380A76EE